mmetsp:Transcript_8018/g.18735  ORF Transcript_8018/g.18735 Transcript_8018/m.18735 type:complete len:252 (-) Transcript_8018:30-785(-)
MVKNAFASTSGEDGSSKRKSSAGADDSNEERPKVPQMKGESKIAKGIFASLKASRKSDGAAASKADPSSHGQTREGRAAGAALSELKPLEDELPGSGKSNGFKGKGKGKGSKKGKGKAERPATEVLEVENLEENKEEDAERRAKRQKRFGEVEKRPEPVRATKPSDSAWRAPSGDKAAWKQEANSDGPSKSWRERPPKGEGKGKKEGKTGEDESRKPSEPPPAHKGLRGWNDKDEVVDSKPSGAGSAAAAD